MSSFAKTFVGGLGILFQVLLLGTAAILGIAFLCLSPWFIIAPDIMLNEVWPDVEFSTLILWVARTPAIALWVFIIYQIGKADD